MKVLTAHLIFFAQTIGASGYEETPPFPLRNYGGGVSEVLCGGHFQHGGGSLDPNGLANIGLLGVQLAVCDFTLGLFHGETCLEVVEEPTLDGGVGFVVIDHLFQFSLLGIVAEYFHILGDQIAGQALVGLLLLNLLLGSDGGQSVVGVGTHGIHQGIILIGAGDTGLLKVELGADNSLADVVKSEVGGGLGGSSHNIFSFSVGRNPNFNFVL